MYGDIQVIDTLNNAQENLEPTSPFDDSCKVVAFSIDNRFVHHLAAALNSIIENNQTPIRVIVFCFEVAEKNLSVLKRYRKGSIMNLSLIEVENDTYSNLHETLQFPRATYGRFLAPGLVSPNDSLLYLDADIIVLGDLGQIFELDLGSYPVGGISNIDETALARLLNQDVEGGYLDSGLLLFNVKKWQEENLTDKVIKKILESGHLWNTPDNHGLNVVLKGNFQHIPRKYTYPTHYYFTFPQTRKEGEAAVILGFAGPVKPDSYLCLDHFKSVYKHHLLQTPFANLLDSDKSVKNVIKKLRNRKKQNEKR